VFLGWVPDVCIQRPVRALRAADSTPSPARNRATGLRGESGFLRRETVRVGARDRGKGKVETTSALDIIDGDEGPARSRSIAVLVDEAWGAGVQSRSGEGEVSRSHGDEAEGQGVRSRGRRVVNGPRKASRRMRTGKERAKPGEREGMGYSAGAELVSAGCWG
jgi:hypothetical protein